MQHAAGIRQAGELVETVRAMHESCCTRGAHLCSLNLDAKHSPVHLQSLQAGVTSAHSCISAH